MILLIACQTLFVRENWCHFIFGIPSPISAFYIFGVLKKGGMDETFTWFFLSVANACVGETNLSRMQEGLASEGSENSVLDMT